MYKFTDPQGQTTEGFQYDLPGKKPGSWVKAPPEAQKDGLACGVGLHLMKIVLPRYAPGKYRCFEAKGERLLGEDAEKARYRRVQLLRELSPKEIDQGIDAVWQIRLGQPGLFLQIAWARTATFLDRPVDTEALTPALESIAKLCGKTTTIQFVSGNNLGASLDSLGDGLRNSLWDSLRNSLWDSLRNSLGDGLRNSLWDSLRNSLWDSLRNSLGDGLRNSLDDGLRNSLGDDLWNSLCDGLRNSLSDDLWNSLWNCLFYERGFALAGKPKIELTDLLEVWKAGAVPLGFTRNASLVIVP